ncbi:hypothetical protein [Acinetobacter nosocomialis]|uniref:hypothetical protein n=1 Tax=Acinetobacter nosocomialis TaxID=106654 RepID=UPI00374FDA7E
MFITSFGEQNITYKCCSNFLIHLFSMTAQEVTTIVNTYDALGKVKLPSKKVQALINAKKLGQNDETLPCPV